MLNAWTSENKMSFLGITFTLIDLDFTIKRGILGMAESKGKNNAKALTAKFLEIMSTCDISPAKIASITLDNSSSCKALAATLVKENG